VTSSFPKIKKNYHSFCIFSFIKWKTLLQPDDLQRLNPTSFLIMKQSTFEKQNKSVFFRVKFPHFKLLHLSTEHELKHVIFNTFRPLTGESYFLNINEVLIKKSGLTEFRKFFFSCFGQNKLKETWNNNLRRCKKRYIYIYMQGGLEPYSRPRHSFCQYRPTKAAKGRVYLFCFTVRLWKQPLC